MIFYLHISRMQESEDSRSLLLSLEHAASGTNLTAANHVPRVHAGGVSSQVVFVQNSQAEKVRQFKAFRRGCLLLTTTLSLGSLETWVPA